MPSPSWSTPVFVSSLCLVPVRCTCHHSDHLAWINVLGPVLPDAITSPDLRACWEHVARRINAYRDLTGWTTPPHRHLTITQHLYPNRTHD